MIRMFWELEVRLEVGQEVDEHSESAHGGAVTSEEGEGMEVLEVLALKNSMNKLSSVG